MSDLIGQQLGQYRIQAVIGSGGMATVYHAFQPSMGRDVAIKVIKGDLAQNPEFVERFNRETRAIASLNHPNILKVFDFGQHGDLLYLVMELHSGGSLAARMRRGALPAEEIILWMKQIASALDYAHSRGIIHRDLKPQNILMDEHGNAILTDFGVAKLLAATTLTRPDLALGTPMYMSPEQWRGETVDARSDIYSLGVMLYELLAGRVPFAGDTPLSMKLMHLHELPPPLHRLRPDLPPTVDAVMDRALHKVADRRFQSAGELAKALEAALAGKPVAPAPPVSDDATDRTAPVPVTPTPLGSRVEEPSAVRSARGANRLPLAFGAVLLLALIGGGLFLVSRQNAGGTTGAETITPAGTAAAATTASTAIPVAVVSTDTAAPTVIVPTVIVPSATASLTASATASLTNTPTNTATATGTFTPTSTPTDAPTETPEPTNTAEPTETPEPTVAPTIAPTGTAVAAAVGAGSNSAGLPGALALFRDTFDDPARLDVEWGGWGARPRLLNGALVYQGDDTWNHAIARDNVIGLNRVALVQFQYQPGTISIRLEKGDFATEDYRGWWFVIHGEEVSMQSASGVSGAQEQIEATAVLVPGRWYNLLLGVAPESRMLAALWERDSAGASYQIELDMEPEGGAWDAGPWNVVMQANRGTLTVDLYEELALAANFQLPPVPPAALRASVPTVAPTAAPGRAQSSLLLYETFAAGEPAFTMDGDDGAFTVRQIKGASALCGTASKDGSGNLLLELQRDTRYEARILILDTGEGDWWVELWARANAEWTQGYTLVLGEGELVLSLTDPAKGRQLSQLDVTMEPNRWYTIRLDTIGGTIQGYLDGRPMGAPVQDTTLTQGNVLLGAGNVELCIDSLTVLGSRVP